MKRAVILAAITASVALVLAACRTAAVADQNPYANHPEAVQAGAKLFRHQCAECHGANAEGRTAPPLATDSVRERSDRELFTFITNGDLRGGMPSWSRIPDERRWQIIAYLKSLHD